MLTGSISVLLCSALLCSVLVPITRPTLIFNMVDTYLFWEPCNVKTTRHREIKVIALDKKLIVFFLLMRSNCFFFPVPEFLQICLLCFFVLWFLFLGCLWSLVHRIYHSLPKFKQCTAFVAELNVVFENVFTFKINRLREFLQFGICKWSLANVDEYIYLCNYSSLRTTDMILHQ